MRVKIIECYSYQSVAQKILPYQGCQLFVYEKNINKKKYLILSDELLSVSFPLNILFIQEQLLSPINTLHNTVNKKICYSFRIRDLIQHDTPYKFLSETILQLPYKFTKAVHSIDPYGNELLLLLN